MWADQLAPHDAPQLASILAAMLVEDCKLEHGALEMTETASAIQAYLETPTHGCHRRLHRVSMRLDDVLEITGCGPLIAGDSGPLADRAEALLHLAWHVLPPRDPLEGFAWGGLGLRLTEDQLLHELLARSDIAEREQPVVARLVQDGWSYNAAVTASALIVQGV